MKRKESYLYISDITKFDNAIKLNSKPNKANTPSVSKILIVLSGLFLVYCKYTIIERPKDKNIYPNIKW